MLYHLEFVRYVGNKIEALALKPIELADNTVTGVMAQADELLETLALVPRPDAYRLRAENGAVIYVSAGKRGVSQNQSAAIVTLAARNRPEALGERMRPLSRWLTRLPMRAAK